MYFVFLLTITAGAAYFLLAARRFDFLSVFFFSGVLYTSPAITGRMWDMEYTSEAYAIIVSFFIVLLLGTIAHDAARPAPARPRRLDDSGAREHFALMAIGGILLGAGSLAVTILHDPQLMLTESRKAVMLENMNGYAYYFYKIFAVQAILTAYLSRRPFILVVAAVLGLFDIYLSFRFVPVMSAIGIAVAASRQVLKPLSRRWALCLGGVAAVFFLDFVRKIIPAIRGRGWDWAREVENLEQRFMALVDFTAIDEIRGPAALFLAGLEAKVHLGYEHFISSLRGLVPFFVRFGGEVITYNHYVQDLVPGVPAYKGLAESNFGSWYAVGGIFGVVLFSCCYTGLVMLLSSRMDRARLTYPLYLTWLPILTFYNFRNDFKHMFVYSELVVATWFVLTAFATAVLAFRSGRSPFGFSAKGT